jgi:hypothetical protein
LSRRRSRGKAYGTPSGRSVPAASAPAPATTSRRARRSR